jgi:hypothetical protein
MYGKNRQLNINEFLDEFRRSIMGNEIADIRSPNGTSSKKPKRRKSQDFTMMGNLTDELDDAS